MTENDKPLTALRAMLAGDSDTYIQVLRSLTPAEDKDFVVLLSAAALEAFDRTFGSAELPAAVVNWVAKIRARSDATARLVDPDISEQVILFSLGRISGDELSGKQVTDTQLILLPLLVRDLELDRDAIDEILAAARTLTRQ